MIRKLLFALTLLVTIFGSYAQETLIDFNFQSTTLPEGVTTDGTISTNGSVNSCTECSAGRLVLSTGGFLQTDVPGCESFLVKMKSSGATARVVTVKYKHSDDDDYTEAGTVSVVQAGTGVYNLSDIFPEIITPDNTSIRLENAPTGGQLHIHDLLVTSNTTLFTEAEITAFKLPGQIGNEIINSVDGTIQINMAIGADISSVVPSLVTLSPSATISPSVAIAQDFSNGNEVVYTVTSQDELTTKQWTVFVIQDTAFYNLNVTVSGIGNVTLSPEGGTYSEGTEVTLTAQTVLNSTFIGWSGDLASNQQVETIIMDGNKNVTATFDSDIELNFDTPVGFATVNTGSTYTDYGFSFSGPVTGGQNATDTLRVNGQSDFDMLAWHLYYRNRAYRGLSGTNGVTATPLVIVFQTGVYEEGTSSSSAWGNHMLTVQEQGDLTIIGEPGVVLKFGLNIKRSWNILIRNITFYDYYDDGINIGEPETHHIWVDHCTIGHPDTRPVNQEHPDGGIDVKNGASYVTLSWNLIRNSWKTNLIGHSDSNASEDLGKLKVTLYANHYYNSNSRNPRVRFGEVHVLSNLIEQITLYGIAASNQSQVYAENNFYLNTRWPMYADRTVPDFQTVYGNNSDGTFTSKTGNTPATALKQVGNAYDDSGLPVITAQINPLMLNPGGRSVKFDELNPESIFEPSSYYNYIPLSTDAVLELVPVYAGADKVDFFNTSTLGITDNEINSFKAFPNPTTNFLMIQHPVVSNMGQINIYNISGVLIASEKLTPMSSATRLDVSQLADGFYFVQYKDGTTQKQFSIIKR